MRTERTNIQRALTIAALITLTLGAAAQDAPTAAAAEPFIPVSGTVNYVMMGLAVVQVVLILAMSSILRTMMGSTGWMRKLTERMAKGAALLPLLLAAGSAQAQAYVEQRSTMNHQELFYLLLVVNIFLFIVLMVQINLLRGTMRAITGVFEEQRAAGAAVAKRPSPIAKLMDVLTRRPSKETEERDLLMHHEYDGIRELDNVLPPWWVWLFYGTIAWSVIYLVNMHVTKSWNDSHEEYVAEMEQAKADVAAFVAKAGAAVDENTVTITTDAGALAAAKETFSTYCAACHGADGAGAETSVGPNLTDAYWIHGGGIKEVFKTIKYGVPEKGMISWKSQLKPNEIQAISSYILSLQGTGGPTQKAPQGDLWKGDAAPADTTATTSVTVRVAVIN
ncbi:MAG TPA: cbb3-type cytochrome c oxidase N-terminal domain-containing protein [Flavobacteriales bacterium]|nr:cbb3-type cytochrome c oxidase N-terminal domain-containing protein [Flavobacteriales bacterium]